MRFLRRRTPIPIPPRELIFVGNPDQFVAVGNEIAGQLIDIAGLQPGDRVLDVGCGIGRIAIPLTRYLAGQGRYEGFDIVRRGIDWSTKEITPRRPNFRFTHVDVYNRRYNPAGTIAPAGYRFPYGDAAFDFVFLVSVVTHLLPDDMRNYMSESARVLRPGGTLFVTWLLLNDEARAGIAAGKALYPVTHELDGFWTSEPEEPERATAYEEDVVRKFYDELGCEILEPVRYGSWCGRPAGTGAQDIVVAVKRASAG